MALTIINEAGLATSNAYCSLSTCSLFLESDIHRFTTWSALATDDQIACIILATTLLDVQMSWRGVKGTSTQALEFPRDDLYDRSDYAITSTDIPTDIQLGCAYYAFFLSQGDRLDDDDTMGFRRLDAGSLRMDIDKYDRKRALPNIVYDIVKWYGNRSGSFPRVLERR
jgi:hypothetical protein